MGKKRKIIQVLIVDSDGNCLSPLLAALMNATFNRKEGRTSYWCDFARSFPHDDDSPKVVDSETLRFMKEIGLDLTSMDEKIKEIEKLDLTQFELVLCFNLEAAAEVFSCAGKIDPSNKRPRVEQIGGISTDFSNPAGKIEEIEKLAAKLKNYADSIMSEHKCRN